MPPSKRKAGAKSAAASHSSDAAMSVSPEAGSGGASSSNSQQKRLKMSSENDDDVLEINVGGRVFTTRRSTLCFDHDSMLARWFDKDSPFQGGARVDGRPFIDRNPEVFREVLDWLIAGGRLAGGAEFSPLLLEKLREHAEFFQLQGLLAQVDKAMHVKLEASHAKQRTTVNMRRYKKLLLGPYKGVGIDEELRAKRAIRSEARMNAFARQGWHVCQMTMDAEGEFADVLMEIETTKPVDPEHLAHHMATKGFIIDAQAVADGYYISEEEDAGGDDDDDDDDDGDEEEAAAAAAAVVESQNQADDEETDGLAVGDE